MAEYKTLIQIYQSDPGLRKEFPDMTGKGVSGEWDLNDWWNRYGKVDYPNVTLVQPGDPKLKITKPVTTTPTAVATGDYSNLINVNGEIQTKDGKKFGQGKTSQEAQAELAKYLGIQPHEINWSQISQAKASVPSADTVPVTDTVPIADTVPDTDTIPVVDTALSADTIPIKKDDDKNILTRFESDPTPNDDTTNESTIWLYNSDSKTYIPVKNEKSLMALLGVNSVEEAFNHVNVLPVSAMDSPEWQGSFGSSSTAISEDGQIPESPSIIPGTEISNIKDLYGASERLPADVEEFAGNIIGAILTPARQKGDISEKVFKDNLENPAQLAKYINAFLYGGYNIPENIYADLKAKTLVEQGQSEYADFKAFDENMKYDEWSKTPEGQKVLSDTNLAPPEGVLNIDVDMFSNPIFQIPGSAFSTIVKPIDIDSPEFKAEAEEIQASYYDIMTQKAEAETEQAKAIADNNWQIFKKNLEKKHGLQLSDNAKTAWGQLQELFSGASQKGLAGTGLEQEVKDRYMKDVRDRDQLLRESKLDEEEMEQRSKLLKSGSSEEIAAFTASNPEKAKEWGLIPSDEHKQWFSKENLKSLYPDMTDSEIATISGMIIDPETGHYRSELYQNLYSNKYNLGEQRKSYQWEKLYQKKLDEERKAYEPYTKQSPFSSFYDKDAVPPEYKTEKVSLPVSDADTSSKYLPGSQQTMRDAVKKYAPVPQAGLEQIKSVFGPSWSPSEAFKDSKDYLGAVRVKDTDKVYGIGYGDSPYHFSAEAYAKRFGSAEQKGIVGEIGKEEAKKLKIPGYF
jgi:hypothetical protein